MTGWKISMDFKRVQNIIEQYSIIILKKKRITIRFVVVITEFEVHT